MARFVVKDSLLAESDWLNVSAAIEDGESIAIQQNPGSIVSKGRRSPNVKLLIDFNDVAILFTLNRLDIIDRRSPGLVSEGESTFAAGGTFLFARFRVRMQQILLSTCAAR